jgi:hypothetical protein
MLAEHDVIDRLRSVKPAAVLVVQGDGATTRVAVPAKGQRWSRVWAVVGKLPWSELRALNKAGEVLDVITREPQGLEDLAPPAGSVGKEGALLQMLGAYSVNITRTLAEGMRSAREQAGQEMMAILEAHRELARDAFNLRTETEAENIALRAELERLKDELRAASQASSGEAREAMLMELLKGMGSKPKAKLAAGVKPATTAPNGH